MARRDKHHLWWPRRDYTDKVERQFRNLACNIVSIDSRMHALLHTQTDPPRKPSETTMMQAINRHNVGICGCNPERRYRR